MDRTVKKTWMAVGLLAAPWLVLAQTLTDPTQPPASLAAPGVLPAAASADVSGPVLQSILTSREEGGRRIAVINGELLRQGARYGDAVVERVGEAEVVLRRGKNRETLRLFPATPGGGKPVVKP
ncbi:MAG: MSHA biogenesis protein MshK [Burkholderiaceae bacterium]|nr:MSHA biogenesis protein MshK [Burkholderiaceae bacterium]